MKFSIITACRNAATRLPETIESVINQTAVRSGEVQLEYWLMDGASTDDTAAVAGRFADVRLISETDEGLYDALGKGMALATGDVVAYLNAGDCYHPRAFEVLAEVFSHPNVQWVTGYSTHINEHSQVTASWKPPRYRREFVKNGFYADPAYPYGIQQESTFWARSLHQSVDFARFRRLRLAGDYFLWTQFAQSTELHSVMTQLGSFRIHQGQLSENLAGYRAEVESFVTPAGWRDRLTAYWETRCNPAFRNIVWNLTLPPSPARIFDYSHTAQQWNPR